MPIRKRVAEHLAEMCCIEDWCCWSKSSRVHRISNQLSTATVLLHADTVNNTTLVQNVLLILHDVHGLLRQFHSDCPTAAQASQTDLVSLHAEQSTTQPTQSAEICFTCLKTF